jgi:hypothetical protein
MFDPETNEHPLPASVEADACVAGVPLRRCYVIYLTLDFKTGEEPYAAGEMAGAIAGLWDSQPGPGARQDVTVYLAKAEGIEP